MIRLKELDKDKKDILLREISRRLPYHTLAQYTLSLSRQKYIGEIIEIKIDEEIVTLCRKINEGNVYEKVFVDDIKLILNTPKENIPYLDFLTVEEYDKKHIDFCGLIKLDLAIENIDFYE